MPQGQSQTAMPAGPVQVGADGDADAVFDVPNSSSLSPGRRMATTGSDPRWEPQDRTMPATMPQGVPCFGSSSTGLMKLVPRENLIYLMGYSSAQ